MLKKVWSKVLVVTLIVSMLLSTSVLAARSDYCPFFEGEHDYTMTRSWSNAHPHKGEYSCECGDEIEYSESYFDECKKCRKELCQIGVHCYLAYIEYTDEEGYEGYGECYCGEIAYFTSGEYCDDPHYIHEDNGWDGSCGVCNLEWIYSNMVEEINCNNILNISAYYGDHFTSEFVYYDRDYDFNYDNDYEDEYDYWNYEEDDDWDWDYDYDNYDDYDDFEEYNFDYGYDNYEDDEIYDYDFEYDEDDYYYY